MFKRIIAFSSSILVSVALSAWLPAFADTAPATASNCIIDFNSSSQVLEDGTLWTWRYVPVQVYGLNDVLKVFPNNLVMKADNSLWVWEPMANHGDFKVSQVQDLYDISNVFNKHGEVIVLDKKGYIYLLKEKDGSYIDTTVAPKRIDSIKDVTAASYFYHYSFDSTDSEKSITINAWVVLKSDGTVWICDGYQAITKKSFTKIPKVEDAIAIQGNNILKKDGTVWQWAPDLTITQLNMSGPILPNDTFFQGDQLGITQEGNLWFWGYTVSGWSDGKQAHKQMPLQLNLVNQVKAACIVEESLIVLDKAGTLYETSLRTEVLDANTPFRKLMTGVVSLKPSYRHLILQTEDGRLWGWGINMHGDLGVGSDTFAYDTPIPLLDPVSIYLDKTLMQLPKGAIIQNGQSFIPLRSILEKLGATVEWDTTKKIARVYRKNSDKPLVDIFIDYKAGTMTLNGNPITLANKPLLLVDAAYIPLRFMSENLGYKVEWSTKGLKHTIIIRP